MMRSWLALLLWIAVSTHLFLMAASTVLFQTVGERSSLVAPWLYLPPSLFVAPALLLLPLAYWLNAKRALGYGVVLVLGSFYFFGIELHPPASSIPDDALRIYTFNRGQSNGTTQRPFIRRTQPHLLCFQDAPNRAAHFLKSPGYEEYSHGLSVGEFTLLSRLPLHSGELVNLPSGPYAARFEVTFQHQRIAIYALHFPTPRKVLSQMRGLGALYQLTPWIHPKAKEKASQVEAYWARQVSLVEELRSALAAEPLPHIVLGDTNLSSLGALHQQMKRDLIDMHEAIGQGSGFTFPGKTRNPLSLFGPWLRLDKVFASKHWEPLQMEVEAEQPSQHRSAVATLRLKPLVHRDSDKMS